MNSIITEAPSLDLTGLKNVTIKGGQDLKLKVPVKGHPPPTVEWYKDGKLVEKGPRTSLDVSQDVQLFV